MAPSTEKKNSVDVNDEVKESWETESRETESPSLQTAVCSSMQPLLPRENLPTP